MQKIIQRTPNCQQNESRHQQKWQAQVQGFIRCHPDMPKYEYSDLMTIINFKNNDLAIESNYDRDFKIIPLTGMTNVVSQQFVIF